MHILLGLLHQSVHDAHVTCYPLYITVRMPNILAAFENVMTLRHKVCLKLCCLQFILHVVKFIT